MDEEVLESLIVQPDAHRRALVSIISKLNQLHSSFVSIPRPLKFQTTLIKFGWFRIKVYSRMLGTREIRKECRIIALISIPRDQSSSKSVNVEKCKRGKFKEDGDKKKTLLKSERKC